PDVSSLASPYHAHARPSHRRPLLRTDGREIALVEWSRYAALVTARRLEQFVETKTDWSRPLPELRDELRRTLAFVDDAIEAFEQDDEGRLISYGTDS